MFWDFFKMTNVTCFFQLGNVEEYNISHRAAAAAAAALKKAHEKMFGRVAIIAHTSRDQDKSETQWAFLALTPQSLKQIWPRRLQHQPFRLPHLAHCSVHTGYNVKTPVSKSSQRGSFSPNGSTTTGPPVYPTTGPSALQPNVAKCHLWKLAIKRGAIFPLAKLLNK